MLSPARHRREHEIRKRSQLSSRRWSPPSLPCCHSAMYSLQRSSQPSPQRSTMQRCCIPGSPRPALPRLPLALRAAHVGTEPARRGPVQPGRAPGRSSRPSHNIKSSRREIYLGPQPYIVVGCLVKDAITTQRAAAQQQQASATDQKQERHCLHAMIQEPCQFLCCYSPKSAKVKAATVATRFRGIVNPTHQASTEGLLCYKWAYSRVH